jgi:REP element-mobilizing transposase RayT
MAPCARKDIVDPEETAVYHCTSRCVRRAFLCGKDEYSGKDYSNRKMWIEELSQYMAKYFALDILSFAVMSNHLHKVLRTRPDLVKRWTDEKVATHWLYLYPKRRDENGKACEPNEEEIVEITGNKERLGELRGRLSCLSWFNRYLKEKIARRANHDDETTGCFWEGRFSSKKLLDDSAVLACCVYVDLNPIRARIAETPEESEHTSAWYRIRARQAKDRRRKKKGKRSALLNDRDADRWLAPITDRPLSADLLYGEQGHRISDDAGIPIQFDQYLQLLDWTGRQLRKDKRGVIPAELSDILSRLDIEPSQWLDGMENFSRMFRRVAGSAAAILKQAEKAGRHWFQGINNARQFFKASE